MIHVVLVNAERDWNYCCGKSHYMPLITEKATMGKHQHTWQSMWILITPAEMLTDCRCTSISLSYGLHSIECCVLILYHLIMQPAKKTFQHIFVNRNDKLF